MRATILLPPLLLLATAAQADDDCYVPMANWQPRSAVVARAEEENWLVSRIRIDDGCYEIHAFTPDNREIEVRLQPDTLEIIEIEYEDHHHQRDDDDHRDGMDDDDR